MAMDANKITYHQQVSYCGKPRCRKCREGIGHGPYWYAYHTIDGKTTRIYIGKRLPPDVQAAQSAESPRSEVLTADLSGAVLRLFTLGQFRLERRVDQQWQAVEESAWQQERVRVLLALLICQQGRKVSRLQAMDILWPNSDKESASNKLNKILHLLRKILGHAQAEHSQSLLLSEGDWLVLAGQNKLWVDADAFELLTIEADTDELGRREKVLQEAITLYGGNFLPEGRQIDWVTARRQILWHAWVGLLLELADLYIARSDISAAIEVLNRLLANDPSNEAGVQRLITVLARQKRRGEALRAYHRLVEVLQRDYQTSPSDETHALYELVRQGGESGALVEAASLQSLVEGGVAEGLPGVVREATRAIPIEPIGRSNQSPLVGRNREMDTLRSMLTEIVPEAGLRLRPERRIGSIPHDTMRRPQCVILMGEPGLGKTRLAEEISREAQKQKWAVIWGHAFPQESGIPYRIWTEALGKSLNVGTGFTPALAEGLLAEHERAETQRGRFNRSASGVASSLDLLAPLTTLLPELGEILPRPGASRPLTLRQEQEQLRLWEAARELLAIISDHTPLLIVLNDLQWADANSCDLLGYLARHLNTFPILFVGTCREKELPARHPLRHLIAHMQRERSITTIDLQPLSNEQISQLVSGVSGVSSLSESMMQHIQEHAAGNPLFAEELARSTPPTLPSTIAAALDQRMRKLSVSCQQLLKTAAILGASFEFPFIYAVESANEPADEDLVLSLLEEALQAGVLIEEGTGTRIAYHFWHPLLVDHLYKSVTAARRTRLHLRAADILLRMYRGREDEVAATITHHLRDGGADPVQVAYYAERAGDRAYMFSAYAEAARHYGLALEQLELAAMNEGARLYADTPALSGLLERRAECAMIQGHFADARQLYERVLELRSQSSSYPLVDAQYDIQVQALLWSEIAWTWRYPGDHERAQQCCERGLQVLHDAGVIGGPAWARLRYQQASLNLQAGRYQKAHRAAQEALLFFEQQMVQNVATVRNGPRRSGLSTRIRRILEGDPAHLGLTHRMLGTISNSMGLYNEALGHLDTALALDEQYDSQREIAHVCCNLGYMYIKSGNYEQAQAYLRRSLSLAERIGDNPIISVIYSNRGKMAADTGDLEGAENWYQRALGLMKDIKDREYMTLWNAALAPVLQEQGKQEAATDCIVRALRIGRALSREPGMRDNPSSGVALVALAGIRLGQAQTQARFPRISARLLKQAREDIARALASAGLEAETRAKGELIQARISIQAGAIDLGRAQLDQVIAAAQNYNLVAVERQARLLLEDLP